jgi:methyl-accepting chemotaxis protein
MLQRLVRHFYPRSFDTLAEEQQRRIHLFVIIVLLNLALAIISLVSNLNNIVSVAITGGFAASHLFALYLMRLTANLRLTLNVDLVVIVIVALLTVLQGGGLTSTSLWLFAAIPLLPLLLIGRTVGLRWVAICALALVAVGVVQSQGVLPPVRAVVLPQQLVGAFVMLSVFAGISVLFVADNERAQQALKAAQEATEARVREAVEALQREQEEHRRQDAERLRESEAQRTLLEQSAAEILEAMQRFAFGDLTVAVNEQRRGGMESDIGKIFAGFNRTVASVRKLVQQVVVNVAETTTIAAEISSASTQMAATSEQQSSQIVHIASSVEAMASSMREQAAQAHNADTLTRHNGESASEGARVVGAAVDKIQQIAFIVSDAAGVVEKLGNSSAEIGEIVQVIEEIADQTNLLALNAAIEAARAGEQGRGFAVVADEVRKLAERTAQATKQISTTIKQIQADTQQAVRGMQRGDAEVQEGLKLAQHAGNALETIVRSTTDVAHIVARMAAAMEQQSSTSHQVAQSIEHMSSAIQETTASLGEVARSTERLQEQTEGLQELVSRFDVGKPS